MVSLANLIMKGEAQQKGSEGKAEPNLTLPSPEPSPKALYHSARHGPLL